MKTAFPFMMPLGSDRETDAVEMWMKPGRQAFEFWVSFFPTAPLFGVEWRFANMVDPVANPFMMPGMPGMRAAARAAHPGELDSPAAADEDAAKPMARAAETAGDAATAMTRIASETGRAAARTVDLVMKAGAAATTTAVDAEARSVDVAEEAGRAGRRAAKNAVTAAEDAATAVGDAAEESSRKADDKAAKALDLTETTARKTADAVDETIAAAPKPKGLLAKRPDETDDLKAIKGIGPSLERELNGLGLYRFDQLAKMTDADLSWIDENITRFKGRCFRDDWVGQAKSRLSK